MYNFIISEARQNARRVIMNFTLKNRGIDMDIKKILSAVDHTLLKVTATWEQIKTLCDEGVEFGTASVCIPPCYVWQAARYLHGTLPVCTVIGFPNGYSAMAVKAFEASDAVASGADEIDMVINVGMVKEGRYDDVLDEIRAIRHAVGSKLLKVIIETCLLTDDEIIKMCEVVTESGADFIKTSTGFSTGGATFDAVALMRAHVGPDVRIKAAGGISTLADAEKFLELGASRLGTSRVVKLVKEMNA